MESVREVLRSRLGSPVTTRRNAVVTTIGATAAVVLRGDPMRWAITFHNPSELLVFVGPDSNVTLATGVRIPPYGGLLNVSAELDGELSTGPWFGMTAAGTANVNVWEHRLE